MRGHFRHLLLKLLVLWKNCGQVRILSRWDNKPDGHRKKILMETNIFLTKSPNSTSVNNLNLNSIPN